MAPLHDSPFAPEVKIMLDCERTLTFPLPAIFAYEDETGLDILSRGITEDELAGKTPRERMKQVTAMCWAGLKTRHPELTLEDVSNMIFLGNLTYVETTVTEAFIASLPAPQPANEDEEADPLAKTPTQTTSSHSHAKRSGRSRATTSD